MRHDQPILVSIEEAAFQLTLPVEDIAPLIEDGEITAFRVRGQVRVIFDSLVQFARREAKRRKKMERVSARA